MSDLSVKDVRRIAEALHHFERAIRILRECWEETSPARCTHAVEAGRAARQFIPIVQELAALDTAPAVAPGASDAGEP